MTNLNLLQNIGGEVFRLHTKFQIAWIPIEMIGFHSQNLPINNTCDHTLTETNITFLFHTSTTLPSCLSYQL